MKNSLNCDLKGGGGMQADHKTYVNLCRPINKSIGTFCFAALLILSFFGASAMAENNPVGKWRGKVDVGYGDIARVVVTLDENGGVKGKLRMPLARYGYRRGSIVFKIDSTYSFDPSSGVLSFSIMDSRKFRFFGIALDIEVSGNYTSCDSASGAFSGNTYFSVPPYIAPETGTWQLKRISAPSKAVDPRPSNGGVAQSSTVVLRWSNGGGACTYDVYFGTDPKPDSSEFKGNVSEVIYYPGTLEYGTTYYWRIDAVNSNRRKRGGVWSFTRALPSIVTDKSSMDFGAASRAEILDVWNDGMGTLSYDISVIESGDYFEVLPKTGDSVGPADVKSHTVTVKRGSMPHGQTVTGKLKIESPEADNSPRYIDLSATDTVASHISYIAIEQAWDYGEPEVSDSSADDDRMSWIDGEQGPAEWSISPEIPTPDDVIQFSGPVGVHSNSCYAAISLGGYPALTIDTANKTVELWFPPPAPEGCLDIWDPVYGLEGTFGPLEPGSWTLFCSGPKDVPEATFAIPFDVIGGEKISNDAASGSRDSNVVGDFDSDGDVDFGDFAILGGQWGGLDGNLSADIAPETPDGVVDMQDLAAFVEQWLYQSAGEVSYDFYLSVETDEIVSFVEFTTPAGKTFQIPEGGHTESGRIETWHYEDNGTHYWEYEGRFFKADGLPDYGDGMYSVTVYYEDDANDQTTVWFGTPDDSNAVPQPTQEPKLTFPVYGGATTSPVAITWQDCVDPNASSVWLALEKEGTREGFGIEFPTDSVRSDPCVLEPGSWRASLYFGHWYDDNNVDGIGVEVGKYSRSESVFEVERKFGSSGENKNFKLTVHDCNGTAVTFDLTGGGYGRIEGNCEFSKLVLSDTTDKSVLRITTKGNRQTSIGDIIVDGSLKAIYAKTIDLRGDISVSGTLTMLTMDDITDDHKITIGPSSNLKAGVIMKFDRVSDLSIDSETPIKILTVTDWLDTDGVADEIITPVLGKLVVRGDKKRGLSGDFAAALNIGKGLGSNLIEPILGNVKISGTFRNTSTVRGNAGTVSINQLSGNLIIDGDARNIKINHRLTVAPHPVTGETGKLQVGGTANVRCGKEKIKLEKSKADLHSNEEAVYRLEDLLRYDERGAWWEYIAEYTLCVKSGGTRDCESGSDSFTTRVEDWIKPINGHGCTVVTTSIADMELSTAWYTDSNGIHMAGWTSDQFDITMDCEPAAPPLVILGQVYENCCEFDGDFGTPDPTGGQITGQADGVICTTLQLLGHEEVAVPAGTYLAVKSKMSMRMEGTIRVNYDGKVTNAKFSIKQDQTLWCVPEIGIVKAQTKKLSMTMRIPGFGSISIKGKETDELIDYEL